MDNNTEINSFDLKGIIEQTPYDGPVAQSVIGEWCRINDHLEPEFIERNEWEKRGGLSGLIEKKQNGNRALYIPQDLHLWEMVGVMEAVDTSTYRLSPEKQKTKKEELTKLGKTMENAGIYISKRLDHITKGQGIARKLAEDFYNFGSSLVDGKRPIDITAFSIALQELTNDETRDVDKWLAGDDLYNKRFSKLAKDENGEVDLKEEEQQRQDTLAQFFRVTEKAYERQKKRGSTEINYPDLEPWESATSVDTAFLNKIDANMTRVIEIPKRELESSIFRRGMELLRQHMPIETLPQSMKENLQHWSEGDVKLRDALGIEKIKNELNELKESGDIQKISDLETSIAHNIQHLISNYQYDPVKNNPTEMVINEKLNCVGASMLGGAFLSELGINYLSANLPNHSALFLVTSAGEAKFVDMLNKSGKFNHKISNEDIYGKKPDGSRITVNDLVSYAKNPEGEGIKFELKSETYKKIVDKNNISDHKVIVFGSERGLQLQVVGNTGNVFFNLGRYGEALEAFKRAISLGDECYAELADALVFDGKADEAVEYYKKAISLNPDSPILYIRLAIAFGFLDREKEAEESYEQAIRLADPVKDRDLISLIIDKIQKEEAA